MRLHWREFSFLVLVFLSGCKPAQVIVRSTDEENTRFSLPAEKRTDLSYALIADQVLLPRCVSCHGNAGGVSVASYDNVVRNLFAIKSSVFEKKTMPKNSRLSDDEMSLLWTWIEMGAPELALSGNVPEAPIPLAPNFASIDKNIFQPKCVSCHSPGGSGKRILLDKEALVNSPLELVIPGNSDESGLVLSVERNDDKRMPPAKEGYSVLSDAEKLAIRDWIQSGAVD